MESQWLNITEGPEIYTCVKSGEKWWKGFGEEEDEEKEKGVTCLLPSVLRRYHTIIEWCITEDPEIYTCVKSEEKWWKGFGEEEDD